VNRLNNLVVMHGNELVDMRGDAAAAHAANTWREPPALTLDARGVIVDCSERGEALFGYSRTELACRHVSEVLPQLSEWELLRDGEPNAHFSFLCHIGHAFQVRPRNGATFLSALSLVCLRDAGETVLRLIASPLQEEPGEGSPAAA
jgi:PAS domain S-box-containing protein